MTGPTGPARRAVPLAFVFAALLALPSLNAPLLQDDVIHRGMLLDKASGLRWSPFELYDFVGGPTRPASLMRERGLLPWFTDEDLKLRFFRPLSSAVLAIDARLFGERTWLSRLHSLLWFLGILGLVAALHRRLLSASTAGVATLIYALSAGHSLPVSWIAARHALVCTAFSLLAFWLHLCAREDGWRPGRWLSPVAFAVGLLAGEMTLGALAVIGAWELFGRRDRIRGRVLALAPLASLTLVYLGYYVAMDYGARGSGAYIGLGGGLSGARAVVRHFLILVGELVAATPSDAFGLGTVRVQTSAALWGATMAVALLAVYRFARPHVDPHDVAAMRWMPVAAAAAALPGALALVGGRVLTLALFPATGVMAVVLVRGAAAVRASARASTPRRGRAGAKRGLRTLTRACMAVAIAGFALGHFVTGPALRTIIGFELARLAHEQHALAARMAPCSGVMVLVTAADPTIATYVPATLALRDRGPERLLVLSMAASDHRIDNVTRTGFDLTTLGSDRVRSVWERLYRSGPLAAGARVRITGLDAMVVEDRAGAPVRVRFDFGEPLDSAHLCFLQWRDGRIVPLQRPEPGETIDLPYQPGPMR
jgi:hypothetical protein